MLNADQTQTLTFLKFVYYFWSTFITLCILFFTTIWGTDESYINEFKVALNGFHCDLKYYNVNVNKDLPHGSDLSHLGFQIYCVGLQLVKEACSVAVENWWSVHEVAYNSNALSTLYHEKCHFWGFFLFHCIRRAMHFSSVKCLLVPLSNLYNWKRKPRTYAVK